METKSFALREVKMADGDAAGTFEAVVSVFGNVDQGGDRMMKGAFARTLKERGMPPVVWSHEWQVPPIGTIDDAKETDEGLQVKGRLFIGPDEDHAVAKQVYAAMKAGALREFSFGYAAKDSRMVDEDGDEIREITDVDLFEVGPTLVGMNPDTRLVGVKALEQAVAAEIAVKAGRVLSKSNEDKLTDAHKAIGEVLAQVAADEAPPKTSQPPAAKNTQPSDNPDPNPAAAGEEDRARINALLLARPNINTEEQA